MHLLDVGPPGNTRWTVSMSFTKLIEERYVFGNGSLISEIILNLYRIYFRWRFFLTEILGGIAHAIWDNELCK